MTLGEFPETGEVDLFMSQHAVRYEENHCSQACQLRTVHFIGHNIYKLILHYIISQIPLKIHLMLLEHQHNSSRVQKAVLLVEMTRQQSGCFLSK